jgi:hypothetical protein
MALPAAGAKALYVATANAGAGQFVVVQDRESPRNREPRSPFAIIRAIRVKPFFFPHPRRAERCKR